MPEYSWLPHVARLPTRGLKRWRRLESRSIPSPSTSTRTSSPPSPRQARDWSSQASASAMSRANSPIFWGLSPKRMPVVLTSRTGSGSVLRHTYGAIGSETDLQRRGLINGGFLDPYKARILLRLMLAGGADREAITAAFAEHG
ncbi:hypothetical protein ABZ864_30715 [Streptomyces sp. NPDC047082]|uniref:hypothetical protein n=1 Tax=Streptomyces sp. NPDC047082 TaxID=3155259 RepID=UPI0034033A3C